MYFGEINDNNLWTYHVRPLKFLVMSMGWIPILNKGFWPTWAIRVLPTDLVWE